MELLLLELGRDFLHRLVTLTNRGDFDLVFNWNPRSGIKAAEHLVAGESKICLLHADDDETFNLQMQVNICVCLT